MNKSGLALPSFSHFWLDFFPFFFSRTNIIISVATASMSIDLFTSREWIESGFEEIGLKIRNRKKTTDQTEAVTMIRLLSITACVKNHRFINTIIMGISNWLGSTNYGVALWMLFAEFPVPKSHRSLIYHCYDFVVGVLRLSMKRIDLRSISRAFIFVKKTLFFHFN